MHLPLTCNLKRCDLISCIILCRMHAWTFHLSTAGCRLHRWGVKKNCKHCMNEPSGDKDNTGSQDRVFIDDAVVSVIPCISSVMMLLG